MRLHLLVCVVLAPIAVAGATYSTVRESAAPSSMLRVSVTPTPPGCRDDDTNCWSTSPKMRSLIVAPGQPFWLGLDCEQPPPQAVVRLPFLYVPTAELVHDDDCRMTELTVHAPPQSTLTVDFDGHRATLDLPVGVWTPLSLIDAEPVAYLRLEPVSDEADRAN